MTEPIVPEEPTQDKTSEKPTETSPYRKDFDSARSLGAGLLELDTDRHNRGFSSLRTERIMPEFTQGIGNKPDGELSESAVRIARESTMGITLEAARQVKASELNDRRPGGINEDVKSLADFRAAIAEGARQASELSGISPEDYSAVVRKIIAAELGKPVTEVLMQPAELDDWVKSTYSGATAKLGAKLQALEAYLGVGR